MNLDNLETFLVVASRKSFTQAIESLNLSQSTISRRISSLEEELGTLLINRDGQGFELTASGKILMEEGRKILQQIASIEGRIHSLESLNTGSIHIGCYGLFNLTLVTIIKTYIEDTYPAINIDFDLERIENLLDNLNENKYDLYISLDCELPKAGYEKARLLRRQLSAITLKDNPLAKKTKIKLEDLEGLDVVFWKPDTVPGFYHDLVKSFREKDLVPNFVTEDIRPDDFVMSVISGRGTAILFDYTNIFAGRPVTFIPIIDANVNVDVSCIYNLENENPVLDILMDFIANFNFEAVVDANY